MSEHWIERVGQYSVNMDTLTTMWIAMLLLIVFAFLATRKLSIFPSKIQAIAESIIGGFASLTDSMIGKSGRQHLLYFYSY